MKSTSTPILFLAFFLFLTSFLSAQETHTVQTNQTLWSIARMYNVTVDQLRSWNNLTGTSIRTGQNLIVKQVTETKTTAATNSGLGPFQYTIKPGDSLGSLSMKFGTSTDDLKRLNGIDGNNLYAGERIYIRKPIGVSVYKVETGDTLSLISARFDISQNDLVAINQLPSEALRPGQSLRVFKPTEVPLTHEVLPFDTLPGIASLYGISPVQILHLNGMTGSELKPGQILRLRSFAAASTPAIFQTENHDIKTLSVPDQPPANATYEVKTGDTLYRISRNLGVSVQNLSSLNRLQKDAILKVGQKLVYPAPLKNSSSTVQAADLPTTTVPVALSTPENLPKAQNSIAFPDDNNAQSKTATGIPVSPTGKVEMPDFQDADREKLHWENYVVMDKSIPVFEWNNDYYYWTHPGELSQPNKGYFEDNWPSPLDAYKKSRQLWEKFAGLVAKKPSLSKILDGYTIVLDPGHGGLDPGAIVKSADGNGNDLYITEHEYVYDIALRMYALLKRHGARVELTVLAPNHLIRDTEPANHTLINEKNQVYNDLVLNQSDDNDAWPQGSQRGLEKRLEVAEKFMQNVPQGKRIFISLHADNNPSSPYGTGVYSLETRDGTVDAKSKAFAEKLLPYLGKNAYNRTQNLAVLRGNDADYKVLVEVHNLASDDQSWAMRFGNARQLDAQKIVRSLLEYFKK